MHHLFECEKLKYVRLRHVIAREAGEALENGGDCFDITKSMLDNELGSFAKLLEDLWTERRRHMYK